MRAGLQVIEVAPTLGADFKSVPGKSVPGPRARGVALVTVLLILAILTAIAGRLGFSNQVWLRQVGNGADFLQSALVTRAVQDWAGIILLEDENGYDSFQDAWAQPLAPLPVGRGFVRGHVEDMQARINLNTLVSGRDADRERFKRLLRILELNPGIADAVVDWMDPDSEVSGPLGAEDGYYLGMNPPYVAANRPFKEAGELRLVRGVDRNVWYKLNPYVSALPPSDTPININTASREALAAVLLSVVPSRAKALTEAESLTGKVIQTPFKLPDDIVEYCENELEARGCPDLEQQLDVKSNFFLAHTQVETGNARRRTATLYRRDGDGTNVRVLGHWREYD